jgi:hypothetical protein
MACGTEAAPKGLGTEGASAEATRRRHVVWQGAQSLLLGWGEVVVELGAPERDFTS